MAAAASKNGSKRGSPIEMPLTEHYENTARRLEAYYNDPSLAVATMAAPEARVRQA